MPTVNKVIIIGNLGKDPSIKYFDNGNVLASFVVATNDFFKDKKGKKVITTEWHNIIAWNAFGTMTEKHLKKGSKVYIEGKLSTKNYLDKNNIKRNITEVVVKNMVILKSHKEEEKIDINEEEHYEES